MGESVFAKTTVTAREQRPFLGGSEVSRGPVSDGPPCSRPPGLHLLSTPLDAPSLPAPPPAIGLPPTLSWSFYMEILKVSRLPSGL